MKQIFSELGLDFRVKPPLSQTNEIALSFPYTLDLIMTALQRNSPLHRIFEHRDITDKDTQAKITVAGLELLETKTPPLLAEQMSMAWHLSRHFFPQERLYMARKAVTAEGLNFTVGPLVEGRRKSQELVTPSWLDGPKRGIWNHVKPHYFGMHIAQDKQSAYIHINGIQTRFQQLDAVSIDQIIQFRRNNILSFTRELKFPDPAAKGLKPGR